MSTMEQHKKMKKLVDSKTIVPGIFREEDSVKLYEPISQEQYEQIIESGNFENLAYNTYSMGRGIFTLGSNGEIINFKGVDSRLDDVENIAVVTVDADVYDISKMLENREHPYGITLLQVQGQTPEIRVRGASQLQNLINEKQKLDETQKKDNKRLIKFPKITDIKPFSIEFCKKLGLPEGRKITEEFIAKLKEDDMVKRKDGGVFGNYAYTCIKYMQDIGMPIEIINQTWKEYFSNLPSEYYDRIKDIPNIELAIQKQDKNYELGAVFGQTTRTLENPFRIMDLAYFVDNNKADSVKSIIEYTSEKYEGDYITYYAETMGKNIAGFMNLGLAYNNWAHRQDFSLSAEICDDAYDDISKTKEISKHTGETHPNYKNVIKSMNQYYTQIYLFASNMKVIEDTYKIIGKQIPENYQDKFIECFIQNLEEKDRDEILKSIDEYSSKSLEEILRINGGKDAIKNFEGYEEYTNQFRKRLKEKIVEYTKPKENYVITTSILAKKASKTQINLADEAQKIVDLQIADKNKSKEEYEGGSYVGTSDDERNG